MKIEKRKKIKKVLQKAGIFQAIKIVYDNFWLVKNAVEKQIMWKPEVKSIEETIQYIAEHEVSVSRYGDGELRWMIGVADNDSFQDSDVAMQQRLQEILGSDRKNHIVGVCNCFGKQYTESWNQHAKRYHNILLGKFRKKWLRYMKKGKVYYNACAFRIYSLFEDKSNCARNFELSKKIWQDRMLLIVEGEQTRLGVGNTLFDNAAGIRRVLCPAKNAYGKYDEILSKTVEEAKKLENPIVLIALGPTATILAYDLAGQGVRAIDIGHIDIEYEWFLRGASERIPIPGKYVNEAARLGGTDVKDIEDEEYDSQIVCRI